MFKRDLSCIKIQSLEKHEREDKELLILYLVDIFYHLLHSPLSTLGVNNSFLSILKSQISKSFSTKEVNRYVVFIPKIHGKGQAAYPK